MREIVHIRLPHHDPIEEPLPPVTSDDDTRLYATQILHAATDAEFLANPSSLTHLNALCGVYTAAVARMDEAAAQRDVRHMVNVLQAFSSARRTCIWADKVFRRVFKRFSLAKENFLVLTAGAPPPTEPLFLVGQARKQVLASQALARSRYMTALIEVFDAAVTADTDDDAWQRACMAVKEAVSALLSENIQTYRSELEGPLIGAYITREKQQAAASPSVPSAAQCIARYTRLLQFAQATLHETSVEPVLRAAGSAIFSTPALLASVMPHFCSMEALSTMTGILLLSGLQIPGREAEWLTPAGTAIGAVLTARCRGNFEILLEEALNMLHAGVDSRMVARAVLSLSQTANEADTTALRIGRLVDRYVRMSAIEKNASAIHRLLVLFKPHVKADELLQHLSEFLTRRAASFNVPWTIKDETAALDQVTRIYGVGRCARMRQLIADVADSEAVTSTVLSIFGGTPVLTSPRTQEAIHVGFKCFSHFYAQCLASDRWSGLPLPRSLRPIQDAVEMVYRDKFPRRSFVTLPQASTVVIDFFHANGAVTTISLLPAHLSLVEACCDVAAHILMRPEDLASALPEFAPEHISWCLDDLQAAGLVSLSAAGDGFRFEVPVTSKRVCVEDTRRRKLKKTPEAALSAAQRKALIDAAVVAIVKASDGIVRPELFRQCAARLTRVPTLSIREVNASVTRLIDLEYVQMDRDIISYRA